MQIHLDKIGAEPVRWQETLRVTAASLERSDVLDLGEITWSGQVEAEAPGFRLEANFSYDQTVACVRCLAPIVQSVAGDLRLLLLLNEPEPEESELELSGEDLEVLHITEEVFDTSPILREQLELNLPMRALCKVDCRGLCPVCGVNRNDEDCECKEETIDPRWEILRDFKK